MGSRQPSLRPRRSSGWVMFGLLAVPGMALLAAPFVIVATGGWPLTGNWLLAVLWLLMVIGCARLVRGVDRRIRQRSALEPFGDPTQTESTGTTLTLRRLPAYRDALRAYRVVVDGERIGKIRDSETVTLEIAEGAHELWLTVDWVRSRAIDFKVIRGENRDFVCQASSRFGLYDLIFGRGEGIQLREGDVADAS
jgi:hypothetical protein